MLEEEKECISMEQEPDNEFDKEAIALYFLNETGDKLKLGYIAKNHTKYLQDFSGKRLKFKVN